MTERLDDVFNQIAPSWYNFRHHSIFSTELKMLAERWKSGSLLNLGCAHGPDFLPFVNDFELHGVDFSCGMLNLAGKYAAKYRYNVSLSLADVNHLPYADKSFDWVISVATYHHIKGKAAREDTFTELRRILKPGGEAFVTVWNRWQLRFLFKSRELYVPWYKKDKMLYRYYYLFSYREIKELAEKSGFLVLRSFPESSYRLPLKMFSRNICLLLRKGN
ncbi:class I SAM-dependent methyltransferase [Chloroflexota bacterium]